MLEILTLHALSDVNLNGQNDCESELSFRSLTRNIRQRKGEKVALNIPS